MKSVNIAWNLAQEEKSTKRRKWATIAIIGQQQGGIGEEPSSFVKTRAAILQQWQAWRFTTSWWKESTKMMRTLGFGSEAQTRRVRAPGNGSMEVRGSSPTGQVPLYNSQAMQHQLMTASKYITTLLPQMDGTIKSVEIIAISSAAGNFAQVILTIWLSTIICTNV